MSLYKKLNLVLYISLLVDLCSIRLYLSHGFKYINKLSISKYKQNFNIWIKQIILILWFVLLLDQYSESLLGAALAIPFLLLDSQSLCIAILSLLPLRFERRDPSNDAQYTLQSKCEPIGLTLCIRWWPAHKMIEHRMLTIFYPCSLWDI